MKKITLVAGVTAALATPFLAGQAAADVVGLGASVSYWDSDLSGTAATNNSTVDVENDLNLSSDSNANLNAYIEHPVPLLPNVRINYTKIEQSGRGQLSPEGFDLIGGGVEVQSDLDLDQLDITLYYELLDNWVNLDAGITARDMDGELVVRDRNSPAVSRSEVDAVVPMGYLAARFDLPFTGVSVGAEGNAISYSGDSVYDLNAYGQYEISLLRLRAGYREMSIDYEDDNDKLDVEIGGPFISAGVIF